MSNYHIIIATERRTDPNRQATAISRSEPTGKIIDGMPEYVAGLAQLHSFTDKIFRVEGEWFMRAIDKDGKEVIKPFDITDPQVVMLVEWDGNPNYVIQHKGSYADRTMGFAGWPELTKEQYDALPVDPL